MIRTSQHSLKWSGSCKRDSLDLVYLEYKRVVQSLIDVLWLDKSTISGSFLKKTTSDKVDTWLSARLVQCAGKQALQNCKSVYSFENNKKSIYKVYKRVYKNASKRNKKWNILTMRFSEWIKTVELRCRLTKPVFDGNMELDQRFSEIQEGNNSFDIWIKLASIGNRMKLLLPTRKHNHFNELQYKGFKLKKSIRIKKINGNFYVDFYHEKETEKTLIGNKTIGIDVGINKLLSCSDGNQYGSDVKRLINKLNNRKQKSRNSRRTISEIKNYIGWTVNQLDWNNLTMIGLEKIKNITKNTRGKVNLTTRKLLGHWNLKLLTDRITHKSEVYRVQLVFVNPAYTSQECSACHNIDKQSRKGELYECVKCGNTLDADYNASLNILTRSRNKESIVPCEQRGI